MHPTNINSYLNINNNINDTTDRFSKLKDEIICCIFSKLGIEGNLHTIALVSKRFQKIAINLTIYQKIFRCLLKETSERPLTAEGSSSKQLMYVHHFVLLNSEFIEIAPDPSNMDDLLPLGLNNPLRGLPSITFFEFKEIQLASKEAHLFKTKKFEILYDKNAPCLEHFLPELLADLNRRVNIAFKQIKTKNESLKDHGLWYNLGKNILNFLYS